MHRIGSAALLLIGLLAAASAVLAQESFSYVLFTPDDHSSFQLYDGVNTAAGFDRTGRTALWDGAIDQAGAGAEATATPNPALPVSMGADAMRFPGAPELFTSLPATQAALKTSAVGSGTANDLKSDELFLLSTAAAPQVWVVLPIAQRPLATFLSSELTCDEGSAAPLDFSDRVLQCWDAASTKSASAFALNFTCSVSRDAAAAKTVFPLAMGVSFASTGAASATMRSQALIMLLHRTLNQIYSAREVAAAVRINTRRRNRARVAVGFLWTFGGLVAVFLTLMAATFQSWLFPVFPFPFALFVWIALLLGLCVLLCLFVGILGFIGYVIVLSFYCVVVGVGYYCQRLASRETPPTALESEQRSLLRKQKKEEEQAKRREMAVLSANSKSKSRSASPPVAAAVAAADGANASSSPPSYGAAGSPDPLAAIEPIQIEYSFLPYSRAPHRMGYIQRRLLGYTSMLSLLFLVLCVALFGIWRVDDYRVIHSMSRALPLQPTVVEYIPQNIAKGVMSIYAFDGLSSKLELNEIFFSMSTDWCGVHYNTYLDTLDLRYRAIYLDYIVKYGVEMEQFEPSHYSNYTSVNDWFIRQVKPEYRPVAQGVSDIVSPADARVTMWSNNPFGLRFWIKGNRFTMDEFLTDAGQPRLFDGGTLVLLRLAPQDYHRFHAILLSTMVAMFAVEGGLQSVNRDGMTSKNYGVYNQRTVMLFDSPQIGRFAYVSIGALCVGSVVVEAPVGAAPGTNPVGGVYARGERLGYFQFGGSTVALVFQPGTVRLSDAIVYSSLSQVETLLHVNTKIGVAINQTQNLNAGVAPS